VAHIPDGFLSIPVLAGTAGASATDAAAKELLAAVAPRGHIVNLGHGILPETPLASVDALVAAVHSEEL